MPEPRKERRRSETPRPAAGAKREPALAANALLDRVGRWRESLAARKDEIAARPGLMPMQVTAEQGILQPRIELARIEARRVIRKPKRATERALLAMATIHILDEVSIEDLDRAYQERPKAFELACRTPFERLVYHVIRR